MLPERSKRYAGVDGQTPRLQLASNWQLLLVAVLMLGLFRVIFPQSALVERLYDQEQLDTLTLSYIENLYRTDPDNADLAILLARVKREDLDVDGLAKLLQPAFISADKSQRADARMMMLGAYEDALSTQTDATEHARLRKQLEALVQTTQRDNVPAGVAAVFAATAFRLGLDFQGHALLKQVSAQSSPQSLEGYANDALAQGNYALASAYFLLARHNASAREDAREYYRQGIATLIAASQFNKAMQAAEQELGDLADDPETLRFLTRSAVAAGDRTSATRYAESLVFFNGFSQGQARP